MRLHLRALAATVVVSSTSGAVAGAMITGKQIKDESVTGKDVRDASLSQFDLDPQARAAFGGAAAYALIGRDGTVQRSYPPGATVSSPFLGTWCVLFDGYDASQFGAVVSTNRAENDTAPGVGGRLSYAEVDAAGPACEPGQVQVVTGTVTASGGTLQVSPGNWGFSLVLG